MNHSPTIVLFAALLATPCAAEPAPAVRSERDISIDATKASRATDVKREATDSKARWWDRDASGARPWDASPTKSQQPLAR